jgi:hypothetical protein
MTNTTDADGWIEHDGGPCPVDPETWVQVKDFHGRPVSYFCKADEWRWDTATAYRIFAPVTPNPPGPSPFVRETAARIMAALNLGPVTTHIDLAYYAAFAVHAAKALEAALKEAGE